MHVSKSRFLLALLVALAPFSVFAETIFTFNTLMDIGRLNGGNSSRANGVSADGSVVVGQAQNGVGGPSRAFRWTSATGMVGLGTLAGGNTSQATGVSADGSVVVGQAQNGVAAPNRAFRWTSATGMVGLGTLVGANSSSAFGVSADGSVVVGFSGSGAVAAERAFRWTSATGMVGLGTVVGGGRSRAAAASADGSVVVGFVNSGAVPGGEAFRWTSATGMVGLGTVVGGDRSQAFGVSADGSVVVGISTSGPLVTAMRWTSTTGMVDLGTLVGANFSSAFGVNADGSVVVGQARNGVGGPNRAFRWTSATGMQTVEDWLRATGVSIPTDITSTATAVNADGTVVVGELVNLDAFVARGGSGFITLSNLNQSLFSTTSMPLGMVSTINMVLDGAHGYPLTAWLPESSKSNVWVLGDLAKLPQHANGGVAEVGGSYRLLPGLQGSLGLGKTHDKQNLDFSGNAHLNGTYLLAEVIGQLPTPCLYGTFTALYNWGDFNVNRGYINAGNVDNSSGKPKTEIAAARARLDWKDAATFHTLSFSPYGEVSVIQGRIAAYTEQSGGFPAQFNARAPKATNARVGVRGNLGLGCNTKLLASAEGVFNLKNNNPASTGQVIGLMGFNIAPTTLHKRWARGMLGVEQKIGKDTLSLGVNATTKGQDPTYWLAASYYLTF